MTESEWLTCTHPARMLDFLRGRASDRKGRLFVCGCCRRIWHLLSRELRSAVTLGEGFADGAASDEQRHRSYSRFVELLGRGKSTDDLPVRAAMRCVAPRIDALAWEEMLVDGAYYAVEAAVEFAGSADKLRQQADEQRWQCRLLRCIFGNPLQSADPQEVERWRTWNNGAAVQLAQAIYDEGRFELLPILADALEDSGCANAAILDHCRGPEVHVRGCSVVDLLLAKE